MYVRMLVCVDLFTRSEESLHVIALLPRHLAFRSYNLRLPYLVDTPTKSSTTVTYSIRDICSE